MQETSQNPYDLLTCPSQEQINAWKQEFGNILVYEVPLTNERGESIEPMTFCFKPSIPNSIATLTLAQKCINEGRPFEYSKIVLGAFAINGKGVIANNEAVLFKLTTVVEELLSQGGKPIKKP